MAYIGTNMSVAVQQTLGSDLTVTGLTLANPGVATSTAHGLSNGDIVVFTVTDGTIELDGQAVRVANVAANTFELEGIDTSAYSTWVSGVANEVTAFATLSSAQNVTMPNPAPAKIDITRLIDKAKQYAYGLPDAPDGQISGLFSPGTTAEGLIIAATNSNSRVVLRVSWAGGARTIFTANVSGGQGFELSTNAAATATINFTPVALVMHYGS